MTENAKHHDRPGPTHRTPGVSVRVSMEATGLDPLHRSAPSKCNSPPRVLGVSSHQWHEIATHGCGHGESSKPNLHRLASNVGAFWMR